MKVIKIINGPLHENCYILAFNNKKAIVVDPGMDTKKIFEQIEKFKLNVKAVLLTHGHFDHIYSAKAFKDKGAKIYISEIDGPKLLDSEINMGFIHNIHTDKVIPDGFLKEGENEIEGEKFDVVFTPGHTSGSVVIFYKDNAFTGDTYFEEGVYGRTDLLDGNQKFMEESLKKIKPLLKNKKIFAGHD